jgi:hypothetical protein
MPESMPDLPAQAMQPTQPATPAAQRPRVATMPESMPELPRQPAQPAPAVALAEDVRTPAAPAAVKAALAAEPPPIPMPEAVRPAPEPREDPRIIVRAAVDEAVAPLYRSIQALQHRIEELERRPVAAPPLTTTAPMPYMAPAPVTHPQAAPAHVATPAPAAVAVAQPAYPVVQGQPQQVFATARQPAFDASAIDISFEMDGGLDGRRRKRRLVVTLVLGILVVFGGLFGALAMSYRPHG